MIRVTISLFFILTLFLQNQVWSKTYKLGGDNTTIKFSITKFKENGDIPGTFKKVEGTYFFDQKKNELKDIDIVIDMASVDTENEKRDKKLRDDPEFFEVKKYPKMRFKTTPGQIFKIKEGIVTFVKGELEIKGVLKSESINVIYNGLDKKNKKPMFSILSQIDRRNYNISWNKDYKGDVAKRLQRFFVNKVLDNRVKIQIKVNQ
jgi:polyisoprenoid-binding protein YceI